jgi:hypothetical protein
MMMFSNNFVLILSMWFVIITTNVTAAITTSDVAILKLSAGKYRSNVERIRTWQGKVICETYKDGSLPSSKTIEFVDTPMSVSEISFSEDVLTGNSISKYRVTYGGDKKDGLHDEVCTLWKDGLSYEVSRYMTSENNRNKKLSYESKLLVRAITRKEMSRLLTTHFFPLEKIDRSGHAYDFGGHVFDSLKTYSEIAATSSPADSSHISIRHIDNILTIESTIGKSCGRFAINTRCGSMPVEFVSVNNDKGVHWQCHLQNHNDIWIPKEILLVADLSDGTREYCKYIWKENIINAEIPKEVFSINSLGVHRGTTVYDYRTGTEYILSDPKLPPMPDDHIEELKRISITRIVIITLGVILILIAIIAKIVKRIKKNRL